MSAPAALPALTRIRLERCPGAEPSARPPVRIFLGSEDAQARAERVFLYSIEKTRDPGRIYDIFLLKNLPGFDRRGWRTGFTNYRFAIPDLAGHAGRAIYNDVDQIYLADPAELFDLDLGENGYLSITPGDSSVMVMDCARMARLWTIEAARRASKAELHGRAAAAGLWGQLDPAWNARDLEYEAGRSKLLHYTALHLQPWQPNPERYSYHPHPLGDLWRRLEEEADAAGFQVFTRARPSPGFAPALAACRGIAAPIAPPSPPADLTARLSARGAREVLHVTAGIRPAEDVTPLWGGLRVRPHALAAEGGRLPERRCDVVLVSDLFEHLPAEDAPWLIAELFGHARRLVILRVLARGAQSPAWWHAQVTAIAARWPERAWRLEVQEIGRRKRRRSWCWEAHPDRVPRVWALLGRRAGDNAQVLRLAEALGWPVEIKRLAFGRSLLPNFLLGASRIGLDRRRSDALTPPWPDLVIASGRRCAPLARWIRRRSGGRARLVHLGRPWAPLRHFDLVVTTAQYGLPARPNVLHNTLPLVRALPALDLSDWRARLAALPRPWVALLVGGESRPYRLDPPAAARLGQEASAAAMAAGGSLLVTCGPRVRPAAAEALAAALDCPAHFHRWHPEDKDNPYPAFLALADAFLVTADSATMIAEACMTGKPVTLCDLPKQLDWRYRLAMGLRGVLQSGTRHLSARGTPRQQDWRGRLFDRLVDWGLVTSIRDLGAFHDLLIRRGLLRQGTADATPPLPPPDDLARAVARVRQIMAAPSLARASGRSRHLSS